MDATRITDIIISIILPVIITSGVTLWLGRKQSKSIQVDIEAKYQLMLSKAIDEYESLSKRFNTLELEFYEVKKQLKEYMRAYDYSMRHIRRMTKVGDDIPDFLNWDSAKLQQYYKEHYD